MVFPTHALPPETTTDSDANISVDSAHNEVSINLIGMSKQHNLLVGFNNHREPIPERLATPDTKAGLAGMTISKPLKDCEEVLEPELTETPRDWGPKKERLGRGATTLADTEKQPVVKSQIIDKESALQALEARSIPVHESVSLSMRRQMRHTVK